MRFLLHYGYDDCYHDPGIVARAFHVSGSGVPYVTDALKRTLLGRSPRRAAKEHLGDPGLHWSTPSPLERRGSVSGIAKKLRDNGYSGYGNGHLLPAAVHVPLRSDCRSARPNAAKSASYYVRENYEPGISNQLELNPELHRARIRAAKKKASTTTKTTGDA